MKRAWRQVNEQKLENNNDEIYLKKPIKKEVDDKSIQNNVEGSLYEKFVYSIDNDIKILQNEIFQQHITTNIIPYVKQLDMTSNLSKVIMFEISNEELVNDNLKASIYKAFFDIKKYTIINLNKISNPTASMFMSELYIAAFNKQIEPKNCRIQSLEKELVNSGHENLLIIMVYNHNCYEFIDTIINIFCGINGYKLKLTFLIYTQSNTYRNYKRFQSNLNYTVEYVPLPNEIIGDSCGIQNKFYSEILFSKKLYFLFLWNEKYSIMEYLDNNNTWIKYIHSNCKPSKIFINSFCSKTPSFRKFVEKQKNKIEAKKLLSDYNYVAEMVKHQHTKNIHLQLQITTIYDSFFNAIRIIYYEKSTIDYLKWYVKFFNSKKSIKNKPFFKNILLKKISRQNYNKMKSFFLHSCDILYEVASIDRLEPTNRYLNLTKTIFYETSYSELLTSQLRDYINAIIDILYELFGMMSQNFSEILYYSDVATLNKKVDLCPMNIILNSFKNPDSHMIQSDMYCLYKCLENQKSKIYCQDLFKIFKKRLPNLSSRPKFKSKINRSSHTIVTSSETIIDVNQLNDHSDNPLIIRFTKVLMDFSLLKLIKFTNKNNGEIISLLP